MTGSILLRACSLEMLKDIYSWYELENYHFKITTTSTRGQRVICNIVGLVQDCSIPLLTHWSYCSLAPSYLFSSVLLTGSQSFADNQFFITLYSEWSGRHQTTKVMMVPISGSLLQNQLKQKYTDIRDTGFHLIMLVRLGNYSQVLL